jgi:hydroxymethylglutaryl-CoA lyase
MANARPPSVEIVEVGPRDGLQNYPTILSVESRIAFIRKLAATGLRRIEAVSFARADRVPQMAHAESVLAGLKDLADVSLSGLVMNERGFDRASETALHEITFVAMASETLSQKNQGAGIADNLSAWKKLAPRIASRGMKSCVAIAAGFGCPFEGEVPVARVVDIARRIADIGADEIALADTIGVAAPINVERRFAAVAAAIPGIRLRAHFHNTRSAGLANADAALRSGVDVLDSSLGGLGGCPFAPGASGNIGTEDLVYMLDRCGVRHDGRFESLRETTGWLETELGGARLPAQTAHVDIFPRRSEQTEAGKHRRDGLIG